MSKFEVAITLGNEAMQHPYDVAKALREVADRLEAGRSSGNVRDANGNTVGTYTYSPQGATR